MLKEFGSGPFSAISTFPSTAHYQLFFLTFFFQFFLQTLIYLLSGHKIFLPFQGASYRELSQIKLKHRQFSSQSQWCRDQTCSVIVSAKCIWFSKILHGFMCFVQMYPCNFFLLEVFYVSNWFVMLQRYDYKPLKTNQWISVIWICEAHQSIQALWNPHYMLITMLHFYQLPSRSIFIVSFKHLLW